MTLNQPPTTAHHPATIEYALDDAMLRSNKERERERESNQ
jgi:hypothetical protein